MPIYYLHLRYGADLICDQEGIELADMEAVRRVCIANARGLVASNTQTGTIDLTGSFEVDGENSEPVLTMRFDEAVQVKPPD